VRTLLDNLVIRYSEAEREVVLAWGKPRGGHRFDQTANEEAGVSRISDAGRGRSDPQCSPCIPDRSFSDPEACVAANLVRHLALTALEGLGKLVRSGNTNRDRLACIIEYADLRRIIAMIESNRDACLAPNADPAGQSK